MLLEGIFNSKQKKVSNYRVVVLSINNETRYVPFLFFSSGFITYAQYLVLGKLFLGKTLLN